jgi:hypothetical protein
MAERAYGVIDHRPDLVLIPDVCEDKRHPGAGRRDRVEAPMPLGPVDIGDHHGCSFTGEPERYGAADPLGSSSHQRRLPFDLHARIGL